jgi:hypothetical protein
MTKPIVRPVRPSPQQPATAGVRGRKAPQDLTKSIKSESGELQDRELENVSGGARISKQELIRLQ